MLWLATEFSAKQEKDELQKIFMAMDTGKDGRLSKEELVEGFTKIFGNLEHAKRESDNLLANADLDKSGYIDYSGIFLNNHPSKKEFLNAYVNKQDLIATKNLKHAFNMFDENKDGSISMDEIKKVLGKGRKYSEETWRKVMDEADKNKDGKITFDEFEFMMKKFVEPQAGK